MLLVSPLFKAAPVLGAGLRELFLRTPVLPMANPCHATGWGAQLQGGSGAQHFPLPKEPIAVCVRKPDGSVRLLALEQDTLHLTFRNIYN